MQYYPIFLYILFGILPSLIWLFYYLQKDLHPEPRRMIIKVFLLGMIITVPVFFAEIGLSRVLQQLQYLPLIKTYPLIADILKWFAVIAFIEELFKYAAVRLSVFNGYELDEPLDIMLYMVVVALGFAAVENILYLFSPLDNALSFATIARTTVTISFIRFIGATFLHTLSSALVGYFMALSSLRTRHRFRLTVLGLFLATVLHGLYNFSLMIFDAPFNMIVPLAVILGLAIFMVVDFHRIQTVKSICLMGPKLLKKKGV